MIAAGALSANAGQSGAKIMSMLAVGLAEFKPASNDAQGILSIISGPGYKSATRNLINALANSPDLSRDDLNKLADSAMDDAGKCAGKVGNKGPRPYSQLLMEDVQRACGFTYLMPEGPARHCEFAVMLDHAARRVNVAHSWIKNAEAQRRQFEADARKIADVPQTALAWLDGYCKDRKGPSGALEDYRIRRRAIDGWDKVVERWSRKECRTSQDRIKAARDLQDDPEIDKFGDIGLFEALADEDAQCVWRPDGKPSAGPLRDYVLAMDAMAKRLRFKVPAYRHPDTLRHPVFIDFGNSRWEIDFSAHHAPAKLAALADKAERLRDQLAIAEQKLAAAKDGKQKRLAEKVQKLGIDLEKARRDHAAMADRHRVELRLWNGNEVAKTPLHWSSKRLSNDLALRKTNGEKPTVVTRADRLGRAATGAGLSTPVSIAGLFDEADWNGRLQAPRKQLNAIARRVDKHGWDAKAQTMRRRMRWLISFSAKLTPQGPWIDFAQKNHLKPDPRYRLHAEANKTRKGHARLILCRLPGLRILSVDLGHRFAAACAVWEAITPEQMNAACRAAGVAPPTADAMSMHLAGKNSLGKPNTVIHRRIGPDVLPDGSPHPAPWARLDRQFLIKLQGEDRPSRKGSPDEIKAVEGFERWAGRERSADEPPRGLAVDALMFSAVRTARLALARHGRRAKIAHNLTTDVRIRPGNVAEPLTKETRQQLLIDTLADWHALATDDRWNDEPARTLWNQTLATLTGGFAAERRQPASEGQEPSKAERKKSDEQLKARLLPLALTLSTDRALAERLHEAWNKRWQGDDDQWLVRLKWLSRWLMPRGGIGRSAARHRMGGLSLGRISTLVDFRRKVQVGFFTRMKPDGKRVESGKDFGRKTLERIERLKDSRIKQLVSRLTEAALGIGTERARRWTDQKGKTRDRKRDDRLYWVDQAGNEQGDRRFAPCHAFVIEDLKHYRPEETRTRRENRQTMDWKSAETRKRLEDHCRLYGLHLQDVNPQYTSRQDSRTGAPGVRCVEVEARSFLKGSMWRTQVAQSRRRRDEGRGDSRDAYLLDLYDRVKDATGDRLKEHLRIPLRGGDLFMSVAGNGRACIQADLNAAANIGLRALMDPDFAGKWWYVPCDTKTRTPKADKVNGSILDVAVALSKPPSTDESAGQKKGRTSGKKPREIINLWRDPSAGAIAGADAGDIWKETSHYWNDVQLRVVRLLRPMIDKTPPERPSADELPF